MKNIIKGIISLLPAKLVRHIYHDYRKFMRPRKIREWELSGRPVPPPHAYKQQVVNDVRKKFRLETLVETGTFKGHMVEAQRRNFKKIYSIELDDKLFYSAKEDFKDMLHVEILQGDSSVKLARVLDGISNDSVLFWLDGHYCGDFTA